jgi:rhodanese-related sulfurtransferase
MLLERFSTPGLAQVAYVLADDVSIQEDDPVAVICGSGYRSCLADSLLAGRGIQGVRVVPSGMAAWEAAGLPTHESDVSPSCHPQA